jgi:hypothetical protein
MAAPQHKKTLYVGGLADNITVPILTAAFIPVRTLNTIVEITSLFILLLKYNIDL